MHNVSLRREVHPYVGDLENLLNLEYISVSYAVSVFRRLTQFASPSVFKTFDDNLPCVF